jgi:hypothetical protein
MKKLLCVLVLFMLISCEEREVDIPLPGYQRKLVVNSLFNNEEEFAVSVSHSVPSLDGGSPRYLDGATVELFENGLLLGPVSYNAFDKIYVIPAKPQQGHLYELKVSHPEFPSVSCLAELPSSVEFEKVVYIDSAGLDSSGEKLSALRFTLSDPAAGKNYYRLLFSYYNLLLNQYLPIELETDDEVLLSPQTVKEGTGSYLFSDLLFNGRNKTFEVRFPAETATSSPRYMVTVDALSEDYYKYQSSLTLFRNNQDNPFSDPVIIHTNIREGLGIFSGYITQRDTVY